MTPRKNQRDPYEYALGSLKSIPRHSEMRENDTYISGSEAQDASSEIASFYRRVRQTSFCKTTIPKSFHPFLTDYYCFMKLRMWEQYGDLYQGCCLVIDRKKLAERNPQVYFRNVEYIPIDCFNKRLIQMNVNVDSLRVEQQDYVEQEKAIAIGRCILKAQGYEDEDEFRALILSNNEASDHESLNIEGCVMGIAFFPYYSTIICEEGKKDALVRLQSDIVSISKDWSLDIFRILVTDCGIRIETQKEHEEYLKQLHHSCRV